MLDEASSAARRKQARVLLVPPTSRDAEAITKVLSGVQIQCDIQANLSELCQVLDEGAGAVLVAEEALFADLSCLAAWVAEQPLWSDLPIIVLSRSGPENPNLSGVLALLGNVSVLERPVRITTLLSVVKSCIRARSRQYQGRDHLAERELLLASEQNALADAERAGRIKDEFLATLSHELRTPLNAIFGWSQILAMKGVDNVEISQGLKVIERNARAQAQIIEDLLDMSRIISGKIRLDVKEVDLAEVTLAAVDTVKPAAEAKDIRVTAVLDPRAGPVSGDPNRLQQFLWNLLTNAVKFTPKGGLIQILLERVNSHLALSVIDSGDGIEQDFLPYVFDRFRQADATTTRRHGGLGLGLAIVKQLVELHGGSVRVTSAGAAQGSTFVINLPVRPYQAIAAERLHPIPFFDAGQWSVQLDDQVLSGLKILVVDDEPDARTLLMRLLEDNGVYVFACESAKEALDLLNKETMDVIVSDIGMPDEDGYSFIRRLRQRPIETGGSTPAVALTAYARAEDRISAIRAGFQHHLTKPVVPAELLTILASLTRRSKG